MNPKDAQRLGIKDGDVIRLTALDKQETGISKVRVPNRVMEGVLFSHAFQGGVRTKHLANLKGYRWIREGVNSNRLCTDHKEPLVGSSSNNTTVKVELVRRPKA